MCRDYVLWSLKPRTPLPGLDLGLRLRVRLCPSLAPPCITLIVNQICQECGRKNSRAEEVIDCIKAFSETDFTEDLKKFDVPTLVLHGDDDQIVPIGASAMLSSKMIKGATLKIYPGAPHGMCSTLKDQVNAELLAFLKA